jgi:hypothetical protein
MNIAELTFRKIYNSAAISSWVLNSNAALSSMSLMLAIVLSCIFVISYSLTFSLLGFNLKVS